MDVPMDCLKLLKLEPTSMPLQDGPLHDGGEPVLARPAPLDMPEQSFAEGRLAPGRPQTSPAEIALRRIFVFGSALGLGAIGIGILCDALSWHGWEPIEVIFLGLFAFLFTWMAFAFVSYCAGLWALHNEPDDLGLTADSPIPLLTQRTAILMPICNEDARGVADRLDIMRQSLMATGQGTRFDVFVLSDTRDAAVGAMEEAIFHAFQGFREGPQVYYRRRVENIDRKAGNIADWVRTHGADYPHMVVLDADSLMSGDTLVRLAGGLERHPGVALIQTAPRLINQTTLFARCEQFAARLYGQAAAAGMAWWSGAEANYWGHNAIIRTRAFAEAAGLPHLSGRAPFGGLIMSHDFVEAALLRRAGWAVHMAPRLDGSYEESPPTLMDTLDRDRRWCQGNIQHAALLTAPGLHWINRFHLLRGVLNYTIAPLWCAMVTVGALMAAFHSNVDQNDALVLTLTFVVTMIFLILPKALAYLQAMRSSELRRGFGGGLAAGTSLVVETVMSTLMTPVVMVTHTLMVASVLVGYKSGWKSQRRSAYEVSRGELLRRFALHAVVGVVLLVVMADLSPSSLAMTGGAALSLMLAGPLARYTARKTPMRLGWLFHIPEERAGETEAPVVEVAPAGDAAMVDTVALPHVWVS